MVQAHTTVDDFLADRKRMDQEAFLEKYPFPVLVESPDSPDGTADDDDEITTSFSTMVVTPDMMRKAAGDVAPGQPVYRLVKQGSNAFSNMITVGRTGNNDIVIDSQGISKFHAHFSFNRDTGTSMVTDAGSTNGTYVNGIRLKPKTPTQLDDADEISFAKKFTYTHYTALGWFRTLGYVGG